MPTTDPDLMARFQAALAACDLDLARQLLNEIDAPPRPVAVMEQPTTVEYPTRPTSNFIPADEMTDAQLRDHLEKAHGYEEYVEDGQSYFGRDVHRSFLVTLHDEDHAEYQFGGSVKCPHVHGKVTV
jgi:hypothetical protein